MSTHLPPRIPGSFRSISPKEARMNGISKDFSGSQNHSDPGILALRTTRPCCWNIGTPDLYHERARIGMAIYISVVLPGAGCT